MTFNPLEEKGIPIDRQLRSWSDLDVDPYDTNDVDPYTRCRVILMNGVEVESVMFSHQWSARRVASSTWSTSLWVSVSASVGVEPTLSPTLPPMLCSELIGRSPWVRVWLRAWRAPDRRSPGQSRPTRGTSPRTRGRPQIARPRRTARSARRPLPPAAGGPRGRTRGREAPAAGRTVRVTVRRSSRSSSWNHDYPPRRRLMTTDGRSALDG